MDSSNDSVDDVLERADKRLKMLDALNTSVMSECDLEEPKSTTFTSKKEYISSDNVVSFIDNDFDSVQVENKENSRNVSPRKARFSRISEGIDSFEIDMKPNKAKKEDYSKGAQKRISIVQSEKSAQEFFAPKAVSSPNYSSFYPGSRDQTQDLYDSTNKSVTITSKTDTVNSSPTPYSPVLFHTNDIERSTTTNSEDGETIVTTSTTTITTTYNYEGGSSSMASENDRKKEKSSSTEPKFGNKVIALKSMFDTSTEFQKARELFEATLGTKYESPRVNLQKQGITNICRYDGPPPPSVPYKKKPASCEIVTGPTFKDSVSYWKDLERQNLCPFSNDAEASVDIYKPQKREAVHGNSFFKSDDSDCKKELASPSPKSSKYKEIYIEKKDSENIETSEVGSGDRIGSTVFEEDEVVDYEDDGSRINESNCFSSWSTKYNLNSNVLTESFDEKSKAEASEESENVDSPSVLSSSFVFKEVTNDRVDEKKNFSKSLLDDINEEVKFKTPVKGEYGEIQNIPGETMLVHSLSNYRRNEVTSTPVMNISSATSTSDIVYALNSSKTEDKSKNKVLISQSDLDKKLKSLDEKVNIYYAQINQMQAALHQARRETKNSNINTEIDILQKITVGLIRRNACYLERSRLSETKDPSYLIPRASIRFNKVAVNFNRHLAPADNHYIFLFVAIRHEENIYVTETRCINDLLHRGVGVVEFVNGLTINNVSPDFQFGVEVYGVSVVYKANKNDKKTVLKKIFQSPAPDRIQQRQGPDQFNRLGTTTISANELRKSVEHSLKDVEYPVEGKIILKYSCQVTDVDPSTWSGFISIYRVVDERGAWEHSYGRILNGRFSFWKYPEDADLKPTILGFDIRDMVCPGVPTTSERVGFQYDFILKVIDSNDVVVSILLSTSQESERDRVLNIINQSYEFVNTWPQF